jgi:two-component system chemotaxis sensor kinase CheA
MSLDPSRYAELFRTESREQLSAINRALLLLEEGDPTAEPVSAVFRAVHTVKGMSATMGYHAVAEFAHEVESVLDRARRGGAPPAPGLIDALFASADALETAIDDASEQAGQTPAMLAALQRLRAAAGGPAHGEVPAAQGGAVGALVEVAGADPLAGPGVIVRVRQAADATLPGVRAFMAVQRLRALGDVAAVNPPLEALQVWTQPMAFAMRLVTTASAEEIEEAVRSAGDVASVDVDLSGRTRREARAMIAVVAEGDGISRPPARPTRHARIDVARLDALMNLVGELVITRGRLLQLTASHPALDESMQTAARLVSDLQAEIMAMRMVPVWQVFDRFPRLVRDVARQLNKDVNFVVEGREIELDRALLDEIGEPIVHLLRNAIGHGIESPAARAAAGKPRAGRVVLSAVRDRQAVLIRVSDDGGGIERSRVLERAVSLGLAGEGTREIDDAALFRLIAQPGFSTAEQVSDLSGRGVGIDAVQTKARLLGGSVELRTVAGEGTTITIRLPLTLAIVRALLARSGAEHYALPLSHVRETLEYDDGIVQRVGGKSVFVLRDEVLPLLDLRDVVRQGGAADAGGPNREIVVIERGDRRSGLVVDELIGQQDIVVKPFDPARGGLALFSGATILADGAPALIMDVGSLFEAS